VVALRAFYDLDEEPITLGSTDDADALLERMAADFAVREGPVPPMVELSRRDRDRWVVVRVGVNRDRGFLAHSDPGGSFITTNGGDPDAAPLVYDHMAHAREFPADAEVSLEEVRKAVRDLIATDGERSTAVPWRHWTR
jgi:hypothetical protein